MSLVRRRSGTNRNCKQRRETPKTLVYPPTNKEPVADNPRQKGMTAATVQKRLLCLREGAMVKTEEDSAPRRQRENAAADREYNAGEKSRRKEKLLLSAKRKREKGIGSCVDKERNNKEGKRGARKSCFDFGPSNDCVVPSKNTLQQNGPSN
ncbi:unnamed protein product [Linum trigynum]|uniref:Uncharacterized protein n=1 Tax=Linum trigynum TaxID=586398 RepID=A0AAV2G5F7_9ROSI